MLRGLTSVSNLGSSSGASQWKYVDFVLSFYTSSATSGGSATLLQDAVATLLLDKPVNTVSQLRLFEFGLFNHGSHTDPGAPSEGIDISDNFRFGVDHMGINNVIVYPNVSYYHSIGYNESLECSGSNVIGDCLFAVLNYNDNQLTSGLWASITEDSSNSNHLLFTVPKVPPNASVSILQNITKGSQYPKDRFRLYYC